ncbi:MAG: phosphatidylserine decarboxylase family protein [Deltaproteobacteria bacterium]|nr:MAG: phosphatidylserine decarboxylase family protein [Deltaproteobacteria bacterium]
MRNQHQPIAVEGYPFIAFFAFLTLLLGIFGWYCLTTICFGLLLFTVYFFRNPERYPPEGDNAIVAPADGKIIFVGKVPEDRYFDGQEVTKVSIFMNVFNVHVNRVPINSNVIDQFYNRGRFLNASLDKASFENEQSGMLLETESGVKLLCVQIAGLIARRIVSYPEIGDSLERSRRYGLIRFGSRVDLYFPEGVEVSARLGDKTVAGETVLGYL